MGYCEAPSMVWVISIQQSHQAASVGQDHNFPR